MISLKNLTAVRRIVQVAAFLLLVYGSSVFGYFMADKISGQFPALACAFDSKTGDFCTLIVFQHLLHHRVGGLLQAGAGIASALLPLGFSLLAFLALFVVLNKAFCGWLCPVGFFQEVLGMAGTKAGIRQAGTLEKGTVDSLRWAKWGMLGLLVFGLPLLAGMGVVANELGDPYCRICPSRILTTLFTGDTSQVYFDISSKPYMVLSIAGNSLFGGVVALSLAMRQPFCRICPMLALHAAFRRVGFVRLVKSGKANCEGCGMCVKACPMDIHELQTDKGPGSVLKADCTLCGRCVEFCPSKGELQMKYALWPVFSSDPEYCKSRVKKHREWERSTLAGLFKKAKNEPGEPSDT